MEKDEFTLRTGKLPVTGGHEIWYMEWGNKDAETPIFVLHGGPGSQSKENSKTAYDPEVHRMVFFDQRGCGETTPRHSLENNTTQDLIEDIEEQRKHLGDEQLMLTGGSWGSTLALAYAIEHPDRVKKMLLNGIFLGTRPEVDYLHQGVLKTHYPETWYQYIEIVPEDRRNDTTQYYYEKFMESDGKELEKHVRRWTLLQSAVSGLDGDYLKEEMKEDGSDEKNQQMSKLEAYYFVNNCFLPEDHILKNADRLKSIPVVLVQGRHDHVAPTENAFNLAKALGSNCKLHIVPGAHKKELALRETLRAYAWAFLR